MHGAEIDLSTILALSKSDNNATRIDAIPDLGRNIKSSIARERLEEMMANDNIVTVRVDSAEQLVRYGGEDGLLAVLTELGRRCDDPDIDYTAYMLSELDNFDEFPVLSNALSIDRSKLSADAETGLRNLRELMHK
ncbi:hypothetical protein [Nocardia amamiensis]|uniref:hypothetical protein n=1 Tax=Nocardia amamiensis TaxID=404578 RepID=UPI000ACCDB42|nr:hypothetical protein [Nocardia amamiensis]